MHKTFVFLHIRKTRSDMTENIAEGLKVSYPEVCPYFTSELELSSLFSNFYFLNGILPTNFLCTINDVFMKVVFI